MGLISHAAAAGLGYALARPEGRRQLLRLRGQAQALARHPRVIELRDRGRQRLTSAMSAATAPATRTLPGTSRTPAPATGLAVGLDDALAGFGGKRIEEDCRASVLGTPPLPRSTGTIPVVPPAGPTPAA